MSARITALIYFTGTPIAGTKTVELDESSRSRFNVCCIGESWGTKPFAAAMPRPKGKKESVRFTVSLDPRLYANLARIAESNDVSLSWAVRRAVAEFIERQDVSQQGELPFPQSPIKE